MRFQGVFSVFTSDRSGGGALFSLLQDYISELKLIQEVVTNEAIRKLVSWIMYDLLDEC